MVNCIRLNSVLRATSRALGTTSGRKQRPLVAEKTDQNNATKSNFSDVQSVRHEQAKHSVLVACPAKITESKFLKYLSQYGELAHHFFFDSNGTHAVVEFVDLQSIESLLSGTRIPNDEDVFVVPYKSRYIKVKTTEVGQQFPKCSPQSSIPTNSLIDKLCRAENIEDQAHLLLDELQLTEESIRLRYLVGSLISDIATAYFPEASVHLYGSSVNCFGKMGCDLDLFLNLDNIKGYKSGKTTSAYTAEFWMRRVSSGRTAQQKILSVIGESIDTFGPGCNEVIKILNARCPLVRFSHQPSGLQCDLTADNQIALRSSELLYIYGTLDHRVRALVFALRCWARIHSITSSIPGQWITNFSLTMMVLFFLQKRNPPVIPTLDQLKSLAGKKEKSIIEGNDCTFVRDVNKIKPTANTESLDDLLIEFLEFYGKFNFRTNCIDIRKGIEKNKPEAAALYIQNPFEQTLNVSKNVNQTQLQRFVNLAQESAFILQDQVRESSKNGKPWGLASILLTKSSEKEPKTKKKRKSASERISNLLDSLKDNNTGKTQAEH
ncbi:poly(A) RNA polymerase, mitochondrial [Hyla sarda]|uniref:poly(A) RNA polymerase, mitochondrial n=1 Tax=Hyla sarda TaxID=327740 RepID=UPI0024C3BC17|nr:poly(A) RNA polymerase, mitochondrial [Hyla sarda]